MALKHGRTGYISGCRCDICRAASASYARERRRNIAYGRSNLTDAEPVRQHMRRLMESGVSIREMADRIGYEPGELSNILYEISGRKPAKRVTHVKADCIMSIPIPRRMSPIGARRRLQALYSLGWTLVQIADASGLHRQTLVKLNHPHLRIRPETGEGLQRAYDLLWNKTPAACSAATAQRNRAARRGYLPPLAWDDADIDNPDAEAQGIAKPHQRTIPTRDDIAAELEHPAFAGSTRLLADAMGVQPESITRRIQRKDAA